MTPYYDDGNGIVIYHGDCRGVLPLADNSVQCCVTSPPYWNLRDYKHPDQIGNEPTVEAYVAALVGVFREVRRVMRNDATLWLNLGDTYRERELVGVPWRVAFALQADGWHLRRDVVWHKPKPMCESVKDRPTTAHEYVFILTPSDYYYYDGEAIAENLAPSSVDCLSQNVAAQAGSVRANGGGKTNGMMKAVGGRPQRRRAEELAAAAGLTPAHFAAIRACGITDAGKAQHTQDGYGKNAPEVAALAAEAKTALGGYYREFLIPEMRNARSVWTIPTMPFKGAHFATMPPELAERCVKAGSRPGNLVLDPFNGSGTTAEAAQKYGRRFAGVELNAGYMPLAIGRVRQGTLGFGADDKGGR